MNDSARNRRPKCWVVGSSRRRFRTWQATADDARRAALEHGVVPDIVTEISGVHEIPRTPQAE